MTQQPTTAPNLIVKLRLEDLLDHPDNPNSSNPTLRRKLRRNIETSGLYPPIIVRVHPDHAARWEIIDGHTRIEVLHEMNEEHAFCVVWKLDDQEARILLATLNRLQGTDNATKRRALLNALQLDDSPAAIARLIPETRAQIKAIEKTHTMPAEAPADLDIEEVPVAFTVFLTPPQLRRLRWRLRQTGLHTADALIEIFHLNG